ncbi:hypothetical protein [Phreatobacter stygius]|uniref:Lipoprotein n=1 Tax=Phreatobacter stygius TaxID=1940610 RepID=A0A4D7BCX6_9HYPH|nr:hypothetical protein [Phreatobacter stygius]QCI67226.1 hypothetical protein E8M01_25125 [Phreatobacter stygius]
MRLTTAPLLACLAFSAFALAACQTSPPPPPPPPGEPAVWGRADCQRAAGRQDLVNAFETAKQICGIAAEPYQSSGVQCMAQRGYLHRPRSAHDRACSGSQSRLSVPHMR